MAHQLKFDGRAVQVVRFDVAGFGKFAVDLDADEPKPQTGDRIQEGQNQWVLVNEGFGEDHTPDGYGKADPELVYRFQAVRPFHFDRIVRKADIDAAWLAKMAQDHA